MRAQQQTRHFSKRKRLQLHQWAANLAEHRKNYRLYQSIRDLVQKMHGATKEFQERYCNDCDLYYKSNVEVACEITEFLYQLPIIRRSKS